MAQIVGLEAVVRALAARIARAKEDTNAKVVVGYTAASALYVHENREQKLKGKPRPSGFGVYWGPQGRPGFLLDVAREMKDELARIIRTTMAAGKSVVQALLLAGLRLQRESQKNVPVEYGNLRSSAFTRQEK